MDIWTGLLITFLFITLIKLILYRFDVDRKPFKPTFFTMDSWMDYVIHLSITAIFFFFEEDTITFINPWLGGVDERLRIPEIKNKGFIFIIIPILVSTIGYKLARKYISKPVQEKVVQSKLVKKMAPRAHENYCEHKKQGD
jgi:hypothetical protein